MENFDIIDERQVSILVAGERVPYPPSLVVSEFGDQASEMLLEASIYEASGAIDAVYASTLNLMTGRVSVEERDTWPRQTVWAEKYLATADEASGAKLLGMLTDNQRGALGDQAAAYMATKIIEKVEATDALIVAAVNFRSSARELLTQVKTPQEVEAAMALASSNAQQAIQTFVAAQAS